MKESAYKTAGVDIHAGDALVDAIMPLARATTVPGVMEGLGGFGAPFDLKAAGFADPVLVSSTDGVGTKLKLAIETGLHDTVGIDLVAMSVNDLLTSGARPLFFLDYFASGKLDLGVAARVIAGIARGCEQAGCALIGGETAEMPGMYAPGDYDLAGFAVGAVERAQRLMPDQARPGDIVLGLASSGVHSNGYSLVRKIVQDAGINLAAPCAFAAGQSWGEVLMTPTRIYVRSVRAALAAAPGGVRALAHITGSGLPGNAARTIPDTLALAIDAASWQLPPVFDWLARTGGLSADDLVGTFNCGIGMIAVCAPEAAATVEETLRQAGETVFRIGAVTERGTGPAVRLENRGRAWPCAN